MIKGIFITLFLIFNLTFQKEFSKLSIQEHNMRKLQENLSDDIVILHVNDVHCGLNDKIGYDGFVLYRDEMKKKYKNVISVDVGDHIQGGSIGAISNGEAIIKLMNKIEFNVSILGNHEFDYGIEQLQKLRKNISSNYICSNFCYNKNKSTIFDPYKIIKAGNKTIGFIGVLTPLTLTKTYLSTIKDENNERLYDFLSGNNTNLLYDRVQGYINELKNIQKVNYVILLTHFGMKEEEYTSDGLLSHLENVDAILDGHTHKVYNVTSKDKKNNDIPISQTGTKLESIGKLIINSNGSLVSEIIEKVPEPNDEKNAINITRDGKERWVNNETYNFINGLWNEYSDQLNELVGKSDFDIVIKPENNTDSHAVFCRYEECALGDLISDAIRITTNTDIAILNGGAIRNNLKKGNLTNSIVIDILPWFGYIIAKKLTGQVILDALEFGVSKLPDTFGGYPQVSGISFDLNPSINSSVKTDDIGNFVNVTGERRVSNVKINGEDLNLTKIYNVSFREFQGSGGDGYSMWANEDVYLESVLTDTDSLIYFIKNTLNGTIPREYEKAQKRVNIINKNETNSPILTSNPLLLGFDNYEFYQNSNSIKYLTYLRLTNYSNNDIKYITMKVNIYYNLRLRLLEEQIVNCSKYEKEEDIYSFNCLKVVDRPISRLSYIDDSITLNGQPLLNLEKDKLAELMGKNIQNQKDNYLSYPQYYLKNCDLTKKSNSLIIKGENNETNLASNKSFLLFSENNEIKNISCEIGSEDNNKFKLVCRPQFTASADLSDNNLVVIKDLKKNLKMTFDKGGNPIANSTINQIRTFKKNSEKGLSGGKIVAIILPLIIVLGLITALVIFLRGKSIPSPPPAAQMHIIPNNSSTDIKGNN